MKASEFVKKFGPKSAKYWIDHFNNVNTLPDEFINTEFLDDLKRLVDSHELIIKDFESIEIAKYEYMVSGSYSDTYWIQVKQAIADVEGCL